MIENINCLENLHRSRGGVCAGAQMPVLYLSQLKLMKRRKMEAIVLRHLTAVDGVIFTAKLPDLF